MSSEQQYTVEDRLRAVIELEGFREVLNDWAEHFEIEEGLEDLRRVIYGAPTLRPKSAAARRPHVDAVRQALSPFDDPDLMRGLLTGIVLKEREMSLIAGGVVR